MRKRKTDGAETAAQPSQLQTDKDSRDRLTRLFYLLDEKLALLESRHQAEAPPLSAADNEKDARVMMSLLRVYEKLVEIKADADEGKPGAEDGGSKPDSNEAEQICRALADRIERLQKQARAGCVAAKSER